MHSNYLSYCRVCCHGVQDMEKHLVSGEHRRQVKRQAGKGYNSPGPRLPGQSTGLGSYASPFPGWLRLGHQ